MGCAPRARPASHIEQLRIRLSPGRVLAAALVNRHRSRDLIKEAVEDTGRHVVYRLERFLNTLGTIAGISPLLGLLGTVIGMIKVFSAIMAHGVGETPTSWPVAFHSADHHRCGPDGSDPQFLLLPLFQGQGRSVRCSDGRAGNQPDRSY